MKAPKDRAPHQAEDPKGTRRTQVVPVEIWLGTETEPGLIDIPWEQRVEMIREAREDKGPMWGPAEWTEEDERRWRRTSH